MNWYNLIKKFLFEGYYQFNKVLEKLSSHMSFKMYTQNMIKKEHKNLCDKLKYIDHGRGSCTTIQTYNPNTDEFDTHIIEKSGEEYKDFTNKLYTDSVNLLGCPKKYLYEEENK